MGEGRQLAARAGKVGLWCPQLQWQAAAREQEAVSELEGLGYPVVWIGEATGKEILAHAGILLAGSERIAVATGIASIWARDPMAMANGARTLAEAYPGRFVLGLGVSHPFLNEPRDRRYARPLAHMAEYLDAMDRAPFVGPAADPPPRVLAALGPKMLALARDRSAGAHPYFVPVEHTRLAREVLGPDPLLAPEQAVVLEQDPEAARSIARRYLASYLPLASYAANLRRLGWTEEQISGGGSDRLVDELVGWGSVEAILGRVRAHLDAGADHVALRLLNEDPRRLPMHEWTELAAGLKTSGLLV
jgi:probable F420-dependent oxidoreductase